VGTIEAVLTEKKSGAAILTAGNRGAALLTAASKISLPYSQQ